MLTIKCPKCATMMKLEQQAATVQVKCPKCSTLLKVAGTQNAAKKEKQPAPKKPAATSPAQAATSPVQVPVGLPENHGPLDDDPFANLPSTAFDPAAQAAIAPAGVTPAQPSPFDLGGLDLGSSIPGSGEFPAVPSPLGQDVFNAGAQPYTKPATQTPPEPESSKPKRGPSKKLLWAGIGAGTALIAVIAIVLVLVVGRMNGSNATESVAKVAPDGYQSSKVESVTFFVPDGNSIAKPPTSIKSEVFESKATGATFFVGIDAYEFLNPSAMQLSYRAGRMIMSDVWGSKKVERNGHEGVQGSSVGGMRLTNMTIEYYLVDGDVILVGCGMPKIEMTKEEIREGLPPKEPTEEEQEKLKLFEAEKAAFFDSIQFPQATTT